jgi:hypothetical protein
MVTTAEISPTASCPTNGPRPMSGAQVSAMQTKPASARSHRPISRKRSQRARPLSASATTATSAPAPPGARDSSTPRFVIEFGSKESPVLRFAAVSPTIRPHEKPAGHREHPGANRHDLRAGSRVRPGERRPAASSAFRLIAHIRHHRGTTYRHSFIAAGHDQRFGDHLPGERVRGGHSASRTKNMKHRKAAPGGLSRRKSGSSSRGVSGAGGGSLIAVIRKPAAMNASIIAGSGRCQFASV